MKILAIETSCDETAAAIVENGQKILSSVVASSLALHQKTGGIIPEVAAREQIKCIIPVIEEAISNKQYAICNTKDVSTIADPLSLIASPPIDAIAVTYGPGLVGSLLVGIETAKALAYVWSKPIIPINHLVGHLYANWIDNNIEHRTKNIGKPEFPALALVVSGGHTDLVLMKNHNDIKWLGGTRDDAAGECFDKCARLLGLGYPGGPAISAAAEQFIINHSPFAIRLPRPMLNEDNLDFSFSGLKTAVLRETENLKLKTLDKSVKSSVLSALAFELQEAICDVLVAKTLRAAEKYQVKSLLLAGGVSANSRLREKFQSSVFSLQSSVKLYIPPINLCTDNAAHIAACAYFHRQTIPWSKIAPDPGLTITDL